jgi:ABC-type dipeptide/oligopeptide/nickel transport system permease component
VHPMNDQAGMHQPKLSQRKDSKRSLVFFKYLARLIVKRIVLSVPLLLGASFLSFGILRLGDANPAALIAGPQADAETIERIGLELGLDKSFFEQYIIYMRDLVAGDWGASWNSGIPVLEEIFNRIPATVELLFIGMTLGVIGGVSLGFWSAKKPNGLFDGFTKGLSLIGVSMPIFWIGLLFIFAFSFRYQIFPPPLGRLGLFDVAPNDITGFYTIDALLMGDLAMFFKVLYHLALPALTISIVAGSQILKQARSSTLEVMNSENVRFYMSQGMSPRKINKMILQLSSPTILTLVAMTTIYALAGSALVELIFSWGGLGQWGLNAITSLDYSVVQGYVLVLAISSSIIFLLLDIAIAFIDKRRIQ